jgi:cytochrome c556
LKSAVSFAIGAVAVVAAGTAYAQLAPRDAVTARVANYRETGAAFKTVNDQLKSDTPAKVMLRMSARRIAQTAHDQYGWFPAGSGPEAGVKTRAKPAVWTDAATFKAVQDRFQQQANLFAQSVDAGDMDKIRTQAKALGEACATCHNKYRERD